MDSPLLRTSPGVLSDISAPPDIRPAYLPPWADARWMAAAFQARITSVVIAAGATVQAVAGDPRRWAMIFWPGAGGASDTTVAPEGVPVTAGTTVRRNPEPLIVTVWEYGPLITFPWSARSTVGNTITVVEITTQ